jgi:homoserine kinase
MKGDEDLISRSMVDLVAEPARALLIPGYDLVKLAAKQAGAMGCGISGSGPTMFSLCNDVKKTMGIGIAMQEAFKSAGLDSDIFISGLNKEGAKILN